MRCLCIGICQLIAITKILKQNDIFTSVYTDIICYAVFNLSVEEMQNILDNVVPTCDLILSQPVSNTYKETNIYSTATLRSKIRKGATHLIIPNCYFTGYDPIPFQTTDVNNNVIDCDGISYYPSVCLNSLLNNDIKKACIDWCNVDYYSDTEIKNNFNKTIIELKIREEKVFDNNFGVDIIISDFIEKNYKDKLLFHAYNHPTNELLIELTKRIMNKLGIPINKLHNIDKELLGDVSIPPCLSVYIKSGFTFKYNTFSIFGNTYTTCEAMKCLQLALKKFPPNLHEQWKSCIAYGRLKLNN